jgi:membrane-associated phospholipid phosphatase
MPICRRTLLTWGPAMVLVVGLLVGLALAWSGLDVALQTWLWERHTQAFNESMRAISWLALGRNQIVACALLAGWLAWRARQQGQTWRQVRDGAAGLVALSIPVFLAAGVLNIALKIGFGRPRPKEFLWNGHDPMVWLPVSLDSGFWSFPSGHSASSFAIAVWLGCCFPRWRWPLLVVASVFSASRFLAVTPHYVGDVVAGAAVGAAVAWFSWQRWGPRL